MNQSQSLPAVVQIGRRNGAFEPVINSKGERVPWLLRYKPTGMLYVRKTFKKLGLKPLFEPLGEKTLGRGITARDLAIARWRNRELGIPDEHVFGAQRKGRTVAEVVDWIFENHTPTTRFGTQKNHKIYLGEIRNRLGTKDINSLTTQDLRDWVREMKKTGKMVKRGKKLVRVYRQTFGDYSKHLNLVMSQAHNELKWATVLLQFKNPDPKKSDDDKPGRVYTETELSALWNKGFTKRLGEDLKDQFTLSYECMMRLREALKLRWQAVDLKTGRITLRAKDVKTGSRTGKGRSFIMSSRAWLRLNARFHRMAGRSKYVFPSRNDTSRPMHDNKKGWKLAKARSGIRGRARWHDLRHTALTEALLVKKINPLLVSEYAGVSLATIQRVYLHSNAEHTRDVAGAVELSFGVQNHASGCERGVNRD